MKLRVAMVALLLAGFVHAGTSFADESIQFNKYHNNAEITEHLQWLARTYPNLVILEEAGKSFSGAPIWALTLTNQENGEPGEKPGMYVDGNTHAGEITGAETCLHLVHTLATQYGKDPLVTEALDKMAYYVIPRVNPDGAEAYLTGELPENPNPTDNDKDGKFDEDPPEDINGDGIISYMRIRDPNGPLRTHPEDPRLMVKRMGGEPGEWRMLGREGIDNDGDGRVNEDEPDLRSTVSNRNYPVGWWSQDELTHGQGKYPLSEPEAKTQVDFVIAHPNINGMITYHTHSGIILRSYAHKADDVHIYKDLPIFEGIGETGTEITGYPLVSSFHNFTTDPTRPRLGTFKDWGYVHRGLIAWTIELWKAPGEEGLSTFEGQDEMKMLAFIDEKLGGRGFVPWKPYDHPVYGEVEIGGLEQDFIIQNPPPEFLEEEIAKNTRFAIVQGLMSPYVRITETKSEDLGGGIFRVRASIQNQGYMPTAIERAKALGLAKPVMVSVDGVEVLSEPIAHNLGTLQGWGPVDDTRPGYSFTGEGAPVAKVSWVVRGEAGDTVTVEVESERGGHHRVQLQLGK
jgi:hypothetical protein